MSTTTVNPAASINPYTGVATAAAAASSGSGNAPVGIQGLTSNDFLTLMTAQLKNQDPLSPTDSNQFLSQLAQLSTVTGISGMNSSMATLSSSLMSGQALASAALVGHGVLAAAGSAAYASGQPLYGAVQVPAGATAVTLTISDASGAVVRHLSVSPGTGLQGFSWDGTTDTGAAAPSGNYSIAAGALVNGANQAAQTLLQGTVSSISLGATGTGVTLNTPELGPVPLTTVQQIG